MKNLIARLRHDDEDGQAMILIAIVSNLVLVPMIGLVLLGSQMYAEFRHMQAAADLAAIVGAQSLPCQLTSSSCISTAETAACQVAQMHGYGGGAGSGNTCASGGKGTVYAYVPPQSCSPYDALDYGNDNYSGGGGNSSCKSATSKPSQYSFIEVQITQSVTVPIFRITFPLYVHAVARHGLGHATDFAVAILDPSMPGAMSLAGSTTDVIVGDAMSNSSITVRGSAGSETACQGGWFTAANETAPSQLKSSNASSTYPNWTPARCVGTGGGTPTYDSPTYFFPNAPQIADPYGNTVSPTSANLVNCVMCSSTAEYYTWTGPKSSGQWGTASSLPNLNSNGYLELFPGVYPSGMNFSVGTIYLNPGIYIMQGDVDLHGATVCVYGAPVCDDGLTGAGGVDCDAASFLTGSNNVSASLWYYYCSPWGIWDWKLASSGRSPLKADAAPTFSSGSSASSVPLNGVTFYMQSGSFSANGNAAIHIAAPNPCDGTGTGSTGSVSFSSDPLTEPSGATAANGGVYTYPSTSEAYSDGYRYSTDLPSGSSLSLPDIYPNDDLNLECQNGLSVWPGEFPSYPNGLHLHFLVLAQNSSTSMTFNGSSSEGWWGIVHTFPTYSAYPGPPTSGCGACTVTFSGGGGSNNMPMLIGQVIADNAYWTGNSSVEIYYRPCRLLNNPCQTSQGTSLVE